MIIVNVVSVICLACMLVMVGYILYRYFSCTRKGRVLMLKSFRKGKFVFIFFVAVPLYYLAFCFNEIDAGGGFLLAVKATVELVVLKFDYNAAYPLMTQNVLYCAAMLSCFILVLLNALVFALALFAEKLSNAFRLKRNTSSEKSYA